VRSGTRVNLDLAPECCGCGYFVWLLLPAWQGWETPSLCVGGEVQAALLLQR
jgi:hypothetical protein